MGIRFKNAPPSTKEIAYQTLVFGPSCFNSLIFQLFYTRQFLPTNTRRCVQTLLDAAGHNAVSLTMNCLLTSLGIVCYAFFSNCLFQLMANTGDLEVIRAARVWRVHEPVITWMRSPRKHQEQVVSHEALGMLFLGNGRFGFKEDLLSNALLIISFYPQVCHGINDSR